MDYPHIPAAFINAIAEEGTKAEAVQWLQKLWNENCALRTALKGAGAEPHSIEEWSQGRRLTWTLITNWASKTPP